MKHAVALCVIALAASGSAADAAMTLTSSDVKDGATIAAAQVHTKCGGQNVSPQLSWSGVPSATQSLALTMIDVDVKPDEFSHWIVINLPQKTTSIARGAATVPQPAQVVANNFGEPSYGGPCPPKGSGEHRYRFTIWALPGPTVSIAPNERARVIEDTLTKLAIDKASLTGTLKR